MTLNPLKLPDYNGNDDAGVATAVNMFLTNYRQGKALKQETKDAATNRLMGILQNIAQDPGASHDARVNAYEAMVTAATEGNKKHNPLVDHLINNVIPQMREAGNTNIDRTTGVETTGKKWNPAQFETSPIDPLQDPNAQYSASAAPGTAARSGEMTNANSVRMGAVPGNVLADLNARRVANETARRQQEAQTRQDTFVHTEGEANRLNARLGDQDSQVYDPTTKRWSIIVGVEADGKTPKLMQMPEGFIPQRVVQAQTTALKQTKDALQLARANYVGHEVKDEQGKTIPYDQLTEEQRAPFENAALLDIQAQYHARTDYLAAGTTGRQQVNTGTQPPSQSSVASDADRDREAYVHDVQNPFTTQTQAFKTAVGNLATVRQQMATNNAALVARAKTIPPGAQAGDDEYKRLVAKRDALELERDKAIQAVNTEHQNLVGLAHIYETNGQADVEYDEIVDPQFDTEENRSTMGGTLPKIKIPKIKQKASVPAATNVPNNGTNPVIVSQTLPSNWTPDQVKTISVAEARGQNDPRFVLRSLLNKEINRTGKSEADILAEMARQGKPVLYIVNDIASTRRR